MRSFPKAGQPARVDLAINATRALFMQPSPWMLQQQLRKHVLFAGTSPWVDKLFRQELRDRNNNICVMNTTKKNIVALVRYVFHVFLKHWDCKIVYPNGVQNWTRQKNYISTIINIFAYEPEMITCGLLHACFWHVFTTCLD